MHKVSWHLLIIPIIYGHSFNYRTLYKTSSSQIWFDLFVYLFSTSSYFEMAVRNGYPLEWFVEPVSDNLKCGICSLVLRDPTITKCGHVYCALCISSWAGYYGVCPERCIEVEVDSLSCPLHLSKLVSGLAVNCKNSPAGCRIQISLAEKRRHEQICSHSHSYSCRSRSGLGKLLPKLSLSQQDLSPHRKVLHQRTKSSGSASALRINIIPKRSPSSVSVLGRSAAATAHCAMPVAMVSVANGLTNSWHLAWLLSYFWSWFFA